MHRPLNCYVTADQTVGGGGGRARVCELLCVHATVYFQYTCMRVRNTCVNVCIAPVTAGPR